MTDEAKDDFLALVKGIPTYTVAQMLGDAQPGVSWLGTTRDAMRAGWETYSEKINRTAFRAAVMEWRLQKQDQETEAAKNAQSWKVGDEVAVFERNDLVRIVKIAKVGRKLVEAGQEKYRMDGSRMTTTITHGSARIVPATDDHRSKLARESLSLRIRHSCAWSVMTMAQLEQVWKIIEEAKTEHDLAAIAAEK
jgi:hypothetical protein